MKLSIGSLFERKRNLLIISIVAAFVVWVWVAMITETEIPHPMHGVPVFINENAQILADRSLSMVADDGDFVTVNLRGPRTVLGSLGTDDIVVNARLDRVTDPGIHRLPLEIDPNSPIWRMQDVSLVSIEPSTVEVRFDNIAQRTFNINSAVRGLSTAANYVIDTETITPSTLRISGPLADIERIDSVAVGVEITEPLSRTFAATLPITLLDAHGEDITDEIDIRHVQLEHTEATLVIGVNRTVTVPIVVRFVSPPGFPIFDLEHMMELSYEEITLAGPVDTAGNLWELTVGYISVSQLTPQNNIFLFDVELPSGAFRNISDIDTIVASFDTENWDTASFNIALSSDNLHNPPFQYNVTLLSTSLSNVVLVGEADVLETLTSNDIVATINLADRELHPGQFNYPVTITVPARGLVWAVGEYSAVIQVAEWSD